MPLLSPQNQDRHPDVVIVRTVTTDATLACGPDVQPVPSRQYVDSLKEDCRMAKGNARWAWRKLKAVTRERDDLLAEVATLRAEIEAERIERRIGAMASSF